MPRSTACIADVLSSFPKKEAGANSLSQSDIRAFGAIQTKISDRLPTQREAGREGEIGELRTANATPSPGIHDTKPSSLPAPPSANKEKKIPLPARLPADDTRRRLTISSQQILMGSAECERMFSLMNRLKTDHRK